ANLNGPNSQKNVDRLKIESQYCTSTVPVSTSTTDSQNPKAVGFSTQYMTSRLSSYHVGMVVARLTPPAMSERGQLIVITQHANAGRRGRAGPAAPSGTVVDAGGCRRSGHGSTATD